ncbi:hypothetical protein HDU97_003243 [Phlyctochytrium planicorne]|nr:hypothetical protein HDU97_003243 [Phlyctochytrium planicorne]
MEEASLRRTLKQRKEAEMVVKKICSDPTLYRLVTDLVVASSWSKTFAWGYRSKSISQIPTSSPFAAFSPTYEYPRDSLGLALEALAKRAEGDWAAMWLLDDSEISTIAESTAMVRIGYLHSFGLLGRECTVPMSQEDLQHSSSTAPTSNLDKIKDKIKFNHSFQRALGWFRKAALLENRDAMEALGRLLIFSYQDPGLGITWLRKAWGSQQPSNAPLSSTASSFSLTTFLAAAAASSGLNKNRFEIASLLGECYAWGIGIPERRDILRAFQWFREAFDVYPNADLAFNLGQMLEYGVVPEPRQLYGWDGVPVVSFSPARSSLLKLLKERMALETSNPCDIPADFVSPKLAISCKKMGEEKGVKVYEFYVP